MRFEEIDNKDLIPITANKPGDCSGGASAWTFFVCGDTPYEIVSARFKHDQNSTAACNVQVKRVNSGQRGDAEGTAILTTPFDVSTGETVSQVRYASGFVDGINKISPGQSLSLVISGTRTNLENIALTLYCKTPKGDYR